MYIIATYEYSLYLELAITSIEQKGVQREKILAVPLEKKVKKKAILDSINNADGASTLDIAMFLGTAFMVLGVIYGYVFKWGPIIWGLIGFFTGAVIGFIIDIIPKGSKKNKLKRNQNIPDVVLIIHCDQEKIEAVEKVLIDNFALGIAKLEK